MDQLLHGLGVVAKPLQALAGLLKTIQAHQAVGQGHVQVHTALVVPDAFFQDIDRRLEAALVLIDQSQPPESPMVGVIPQGALEERHGGDQGFLDQRVVGIIPVTEGQRQA